MTELSRLLVDGMGACEFVQDLVGFKESEEVMKQQWEVASDAFVAQCGSEREVKSFLNKYESLQVSVDCWKFEGPLAFLHATEKDATRDEELKRMERFVNVAPTCKRVLDTLVTMASKMSWDRSRAAELDRLCTFRESMKTLAPKAALTIATLMLTNAILATPKSDFKKVTDQVVLYAKQKLQLKESDFPRKLQDILAA